MENIISTDRLKSRGGKEYPTYNKRTKGTWIRHILHRTAFKNTLLKERQRKWREDEEEDVSSYCKTLRKGDDTLN